MRCWGSLTLQSLHPRLTRRHLRLMRLVKWEISWMHCWASLILQNHQEVLMRQTRWEISWMRCWASITLSRRRKVMRRMRKNNACLLRSRRLLFLLHLTTERNHQNEQSCNRRRHQLKGNRHRCNQSIQHQAPQRLHHWNVIQAGLSR